MGRWVQDRTVLGKTVAINKDRIIGFFKSKIFLTALSAVILFSTVFFPLVFAYPSEAEPSKRCLVLIAVIFMSIFEIITYVLLARRLFTAKLRAATDKLIDMAHGGEVEGIDVKTSDVTLRDLIAAVNATANEYKRLADVRKSFVANASHELRSPLTSIQGFLQAVLDGTISQEESEKYLKIALSETKRLNSLITSLLDLSRLDSGKNPVIPRKFNINEVINEVVVHFEPSLIKKSLQISVDFSREVCYVYADKEKITQVITNLIDNAIKYSPAYSRIVLTTTIHDNKVLVSVKDFGYGISKKDQMLIWDTFYMSDKSRSPVKTKGSGLGLSIVKKIIDEHDERIWVESNRGAGATFIFTLTLFDISKHKNAMGHVIKSSDEGAADTETMEK